MEQDLAGRGGPGALDNKPSTSYPPGSPLVQGKEEGEQVETWRGLWADAPLGPIPRERPLHPNQLGSLSQKLVGGELQKL